jgi:putative cardiolipin synthase
VNARRSASRAAPTRWAGAALLVLGLVLTACSTPPPPPAIASQFALPPRADSPFTAVEDGVHAKHGESVSGFVLLPMNQDALEWRLDLIELARHSLDLQYYIWFGDKTGQLLLARIVAAADRGVRVRLLFDDLNTVLHDMASIELRDAALRTIDRHPNIEIRVFNAWEQRHPLGRLVESIAEFERLNRRMHNKQMIADNRVVIIGGRNIGDQYFGLHAEHNFYDLDVLGVGPVARQASAAFDRYWNSEWVRGLPRDADIADKAAPSPAADEARRELQADPRARLVLAGQRDPSPQIERLPRLLQPGGARVHTDSPSPSAEGQEQQTPRAFRAMMMSAQNEVLITNAYIIPDSRFIDDLRTLIARGVTVRILTNSLASQDVPAVNAHYERWREPIARSGTRLHELRPDPALRSRLVETAPVRGKFVGLHGKAMVVDRQRAFIGSMNLDPRSELINSEMGVLIDSAPLAAEIADDMLHDMSGANSWEVVLDADGNLSWIDDNGRLRSQPARNAWQRAQNLFFKLLPESLY